METAMRENDQALQEDRARRLAPTTSELQARLARRKRPTIQKLHTRVDALTPSDEHDPPVSHAAEVQPAPAYMEHEGGTGPPQPTRRVVAALGDESAQMDPGGRSSTRIVPYRSRV